MVALIGCGEGERGAGPKAPAPGATPPEGAAVAPAPDPAERYAATAAEVGLDPDAHGEAANEYGVKPQDALAAGLTACRDAGDCPAGVTRERARQIICENAGDC